jgi:hypothetical protein
VKSTAPTSAARVGCVAGRVRACIPGVRVRAADRRCHGHPPAIVPLLADEARTRALKTCPERARERRTNTHDRTSSPPCPHGLFLPFPKARASGARRDQAHRERALPDGARPLRRVHPTRPTAPNARPRATFTARTLGPSSGPRWPRRAQGRTLRGGRGSGAWRSSRSCAPCAPKSGQATEGLRAILSWGGGACSGGVNRRSGRLASEGRAWRHVNAPLRLVRRDHN